MSRRHPSTFKPMIDANLTSMSDLTFLLLITFIITFPMIENGISVKLPKGESQRIDPQQQMGVVTVDREGRLFLGGAGAPVSIEELEADPRTRKILEEDYYSRLREGKIPFKKELCTLEEATWGPFSGVSPEVRDELDRKLRSVH